MERVAKFWEPLENYGGRSPLTQKRAELAERSSSAGRLCLEPQPRIVLRLVEISHHAPDQLDRNRLHLDRPAEDLERLSRLRVDTFCPEYRLHLPGQPLDVRRPSLLQVQPGQLHARQGLIVADLFLGESSPHG